MKQKDVWIFSIICVKMISLTKEVQLLIYIQKILNLNQQASGHFQTEAPGQPIPAGIAETGRLMFQEI